MTRRTVLAAVVLALAACGHGEHKPAVPPVLLFSPNGEPLSGGALGQPECKTAMDGWFDRLAAANGGRIDRAAFLADARTQFARMDLNHDGLITADELAVFRRPYVDIPEVPSKDEAGGRRRPRAAPPIPVSEDPVMSADLNLDFQVSLDEFLAQADQVFRRLNTGGDGALNRETLRNSCPIPRTPAYWAP